MAESLDELIERSLDFTVLAAGITSVRQPHSTGWRAAPELIVAQPTDGARGRLEIEGGPTIIVGDGDAFCVPQGLRHRATLITPAGISRWAHVSYRTLGSIDPLLLLEPVFLLPGSAGARVGAICGDLAELEGACASIATAARRRALGFELLSLVAGVAKPRGNALARARALQRLAPALALVERTIALGGPSVRAMAKAAGISRSRLHALFHDALGFSPMQHILASRIAAARQLLIATDASIAEVATRSGFGDPFHFSRMFRRTTGLSPSQYRSQGFVNGL